jgi:hypothetical protein
VNDVERILAEKKAREGGRPRRSEIAEKLAQPAEPIPHERCTCTYADYYDRGTREPDADCPEHKGA